MWSVGILRFFLSSRFSNLEFFKAPVPARSNEIIPANYFFLFPRFLPPEMEMMGHFFIKGGLLPHSWVSRLKILFLNAHRIPP